MCTDVCAQAQCEHMSSVLRVLSLSKRMNQILISAWGLAWGLMVMFGDTPACHDPRRVRGQPGQGLTSHTCALQTSTEDWTVTILALVVKWHLSQWLHGPRSGRQEGWPTGKHVAVHHDTWLLGQVVLIQP